MARPPERTNSEIIKAGLELEAETGERVRPSTIRERIGGGNTNRIRQIWDDYCDERARAAAAENDPDLILSPALLELFEADQRAQLAQMKERFLTVYRATKAESAANFAGERAVIMHEVATTRDALREADDQNDKLAADIQAVQRQIEETRAALEKEKRRSDQLEGQLAAAERTIIAAQDAAAHARSDQVGVRSELASMTERALKAEMAIEQGRNRTSNTRLKASRKSS